MLHKNKEASAIFELSTIVNLADVIHTSSLSEKQGETFQSEE